MVKKIFIIDDYKKIYNDKYEKNIRKITKIARSCTKYVDYEVLTSEKYINLSRKFNLNNIALEITNKSIPLEKYYFSNSTKISLILGNEKFGISNDILNICDMSVHIDMGGNNSSMNVANAAAIAIYKIINDIN